MSWKRVRGHEAQAEAFDRACAAAGWPTPIFSSGRPASVNDFSPSNLPRRCYANHVQRPAGSKAAINVRPAPRLKQAHIPTSSLPRVHRKRRNSRSP